MDDEAVYKRMVEFTEKLMPENVDRVVLHEGTRPLFHTYGVEQDFERIFQRRVELPSGGSVVMAQRPFNQFAVHGIVSGTSEAFALSIASWSSFTPCVVISVYGTRLFV